MTYTTDPIADLATRLRNAAAVRHRTVELPHSKVKERIAHVLKEEGYVEDVAHKDRLLTITLSFVGDMPKISATKRISKPGRRIYEGSRQLPKVREGLGIAIVSTSQGIMTAETARKRHLGGEVLLEVY